MSENYQWRKLKEQAQQACRQNKHRMTVFNTISGPQPFRARAICKQCGLEADVILYPAPNEIDIAGPALTLTCFMKRKQRMNEADVQWFFNALGGFQSAYIIAKEKGVLEHLAKEHGDKVKDDLAKLEEVVDSLLDELEE